MWRGEKESTHLQQRILKHITSRCRNLPDAPRAIIRTYAHPALLIEERDRLNRAIDALPCPSRRGRTLRPSLTALLPRITNASPCPGCKENSISANESVLGSEGEEANGQETLAFLHGSVGDDPLTSTKNLRPGAEREKPL